MNSCELVTKAKELIEEHGWTRNTRKRVDGSLCAIGALALALTGDPFSNEIYERPDEESPKVYQPVFDALIEARPVREKKFKVNNVFSVNDLWITDKEDAVAWFERARQKLC